MASSRRPERVRATPRLRLTERALRDRSRSLVGWSLGVVAYLGLIVAFWPSIRDNSEIVSAIQNYPDAMKEFFGGAATFDYTKPAGFLNTQLFSLMAPLLVTGFALTFGASLAGEEHDGQLDLVLALPVTRTRVVAERAVAVAAGVVLLTAVAFAVLAVVGSVVGLGVGWVDLAAACTGTGLVALVHGMLALTLGAATGNRPLAAGLTSAAFAAGYLAQALSGLVSSLHPLRLVSALHHANGTAPITNGFPVAHYLLLLAMCLLLAAAALLVFNRRDLRA